MRYLKALLLAGAMCGLLGLAACQSDQSGQNGSNNGSTNQQTQQGPTTRSVGNGAFGEPPP